MRSIEPLQTVVAVLVAAAGAAAILFATRRGALLRPTQGAVLVSTRAVLFGLVALAVLDPVARHTRARSVPPRIVVLLDASQSMSICDVRGGPTRWQQATALLQPPSPLADLLDQADAHPYSFADHALPWDPRSAATPDGPTTDIGTALREAMRDAGPGVAAVVLVTDGQDSQGASADDLAAHAAGAPVYAIGVGSETPPADVQVATLAVPRTLDTGDRGMATVTVLAPGFEGQKIQVTFQAGAQESKATAAAGDGGVARCQFPIEAKEIGLLRCRAAVAPQTGELTSLNNARTAFVRVTQGKRRILWVDRPRQEFAFLRRAVRSLPKAKLDVFLQKAKEGAFLREGESGRKERLPDGRTLPQYDAVLVGDVPAATLGPEFMGQVADLVRQRGSGFGALGGPSAFSVGGYAGTPIADLMPLSLGRLDGYRPGGFRVRAEPGATHALVAVAGAPQRTAAGTRGRSEWEGLPNLEGANETHGARPGAQVILQGMAPGRRAIAIAAVQRVGAGKAFCFASDSSWRWALSDASTDETARIHAAFWRRVFLWLATRENDQPVRLALDRDVCAVGKPVRIIADVSGDDFAPVSDAVVSADVVGPSKAGQKLELPAVQAAAGRYEAAYRPLAPGDYRVTVTAERDGRRLGQDQRDLAAQAEVEEYRTPVLNRPLLEALAERTGGEYVPVGQAERLGSAPALTPTSVTTFSLSHWARTWPFLAIVVLVAGLDWGLRRRWGAG